ncbi:metallophosphoesterase [Prevotella copri]|jgi:predicted MPP superfamily phosphohydrolase|uniref:Metallophosphoesterase n=1 Tax=Segatella copri TaxID=165179 RepID=A0A415F1G8_9BACT|nr:metallophosphoesterase [Segatella copri]MBM0264519.1 metallophosphoesterase [Segatella copri]MCF0066542.1 metallophosphoesterase [Segatella copri]MCP9500457.1 metallophosphoesterase [Segatella copri]MCP9503678.1 metallophosphoesterase [Segatella copri]MCP9506635.1 metallophosphoesterase [Segatella copri]
MKKVLKKILRSIFYIVAMSVLAFLPDFWLWHIGVSEWPLLLAILWWVPSLLLVLAEVGLQMGFFHKLSVRVLFTTILFSAFPKVVFILFDAFLPWFFALIPALGVMGWFAFGFIEGWKRLELKHITFTSPDLPPYFDGYRLVQITDFHLGSFPPGNDFVQKVVDATNNEEPDMILFTGDLVNNQASEVEPYLDTLGQLHASDGIYSIWGNHDYCEYGNNHSIGALKRNRRMLYGYQESLGWHQLMNEHHVVSHGMASIAVIGVENPGQPPFTNRSNLKKAMKGLNPDMFKILLSHDPHHWRREVVGKKIQLTLAGHTHAGQLKIGKWTPARMAFKEWGGAYRIGEQMLYVSSGIGGSFPFRLGAWPELTVITLKRDL